MLMGIRQLVLMKTVEGWLETASNLDPTAQVLFLPQKKAWLQKWRKIGELQLRFVSTHDKSTIFFWRFWVHGAVIMCAKNRIFLFKRSNHLNNLVRRHYSSATRNRRVVVTGLGIWGLIINVHALISLFSCYFFDPSVKCFSYGRI